ncbi:MAG: hypothetical protein HKN00_02540 [Flavobacteriaceae bacterium]|nr:hypothetical protein [Bacteroidia bacterium]MBT8287400.1 hypothetical protein [Bacteroidia bacterium]NNF74035.1 hypothetical protein [Flavobacteriaceae bacterium]NNK74123.1 hypothetical protein [Flavobacteriaceae bacterium]
MRHPKKHLSILIGLLAVFMYMPSVQQLNAQNTEKHRIRLKADYIKIMDSISYLNINASARIDKENIVIPNIELDVYNEVDGEEIILGKTKTDGNGDCRFTLPPLVELIPDSTKTYMVGVSFNGNEKFRKASRSVEFKNAEIKAELITKDSLNYVSATLMDKSTDSVIPDESLIVQIDRLFLPLKIGEEFNMTDENGTILVPVEKGIPGVGGILAIEVVLEDNDTYGTLKARLHAPIGEKIVDESTFDKRTMWSPRNKTPLFLLIFPNLLILGMWGFIVYLLFNLYRIYKSKV